MLDYVYVVHDLDQELRKLENKYNKNSIEAYYSSSRDDETLRWKGLFEDYLFSGSDLRLINTISYVSYLIIPKSYLLDGVMKYLDAVELRNKLGYMSVVIISNNMEKYKTILKLLNERNIITLLLTNDIEDKKIAYSNLSVSYTENLKKEYKKYNLRRLKIRSVENEIIS